MESGQGYISDNSEVIGGRNLTHIFGFCSSEIFLSVVSKSTSMESGQGYISDNSEVIGGRNLTHIFGFCSSEICLSVVSKSTSMESKLT